MVFNSKLLLFFFAFTLISCELNMDNKSKRKKNHPGNSLWKKEYESELSDAMLSNKHEKNFTRIAQASPSDTEAVLEKLMDSITASEKHLKKVESIDFRLNRLDIEVHEKTTAILQRLSDIFKTVQNQMVSDKWETMISDLKNDIERINSGIEKSHRLTPKDNADGNECHMDNVLDNRLLILETNVKSVKNSVDAISAVISEVKNRQPGRIRTVSADHGGASVDTLTLISEFRKAIQEQKSRKCDCKLTGRIERAERYPTDCREIQMQGFNVSGIYKIKPEEMEPFYVLCDLTSAGGGWTVIQNRFDGSQEFYKNWSEYKHGFGNLAGEFWLGLEKIYYLTNQKLYELRVDMETSSGQEGSATYSVFTIGPEYENYRISTIGTYRGNAGDSLSYHAGQKFSTYDSDNDEWKEGSCSVEHGGAWWYKKCDKRYTKSHLHGNINPMSNLNGHYPTSADENTEQSTYWVTFRGPNSPLYKTKMMIRPLPATRALEYNEQARAGFVEGVMNQERHRSRQKDKGNPPRGRLSHRFDDSIHADAFFPNYA